MTNEETQLADTCPLCTRELVPGASIDEHHLIPKLKGGRKGPTVMLHKVCHAKIHSVFKEGELARTYNTIEKLLEHEEIQKFVVWVAKKHPEFYESSKRNKRRR
jgi:hypothetical protein